MVPEGRVFWYMMAVLEDRGLVPTSLGITV